MKIFGRVFEKKVLLELANPRSLGDLRFMSTAAMERGLDGSEERFAEYFFAIYHCSPDEVAGTNERREQLRLAYPANVIPVGLRYVLTGDAAYLALAAYYQALASCQTLADNFRDYAYERLEAITNLHDHSRSLPIPIDLTEGQLSEDVRLEFLTCIALYNRQIAHQET